MYNIVKTKNHAVTLGVVDKNLTLAEGLREVTYTDIFGTAHTVYAHRDGPFTTPEAVVEAHRAGTLHTFADNETAIAFLREQGDHVTADSIATLPTNDAPVDGEQGGDE